MATPIVMDSIELGDWVIACDVAGTRAAYATLQRGYAEECGCLYCRNYASARPRVFPSEAVAAFDRMGIDMAREGEAYELGPVETASSIPPGLVLYGGWFFVKGRIAREGSAVVAYGDGFTLYATDKRGPQAPAVFGDGPLVRLEFNARVPWVLDEPYPGP